MMYQKSFFLATALFFSVYAYSEFDVSLFYSDYNNIMLELYHDLDAKISNEERQCVSKTGGSPVYGEILFDSVNFLLNQLQLTKNDVFYDLGSGLGKFVVHVYLMTPTKKSVGIEFSQSRYKRATSIQAKVPKVYNQTFKSENSMRKMFDQSPLVKTKGKKFEFINDCMLSTDISDATVVFTCSTCFELEFMYKLANKLADIDNLRIITLKKFPYHEHIHYVTKYTLSMTWSQDVPVYMYKVDKSKVAPAVDDTQDAEKINVAA